MENLGMGGFFWYFQYRGSVGVMCLSYSEKAPEFFSYTGVPTRFSDLLVQDMLWSWLISMLENL